LNRQLESIKRREELLDQEVETTTKEVESKEGLSNTIGNVAKFVIAPIGIMDSLFGVNPVRGAIDAITGVEGAREDLAESKERLELARESIEARLDELNEERAFN